MNPPLLTEMLLTNIRKYGTRAALYFEDKESKWQPISWDEFGNRINRTALALLEAGIKKGECVGIISQNMPEWTILDYALQCIGAVSVPLYPTASLAQIEYILRQTETRFVFAGEESQYNLILELHQQKGIPEAIFAFSDTVTISADCPGMHFDKFCQNDLIKGSEAVPLENKCEPEDLCTILYTSGTSGEPKGVMLHNSTFAQCVKIHQQRLIISDKDVSFAFLPLCHVFERGWTFVALSTGMTNYYLNNPRKVIDAIKVVKPTIMCAVPRFFEKTFAGVQTELAKMSPVKRSIFNWGIRAGNRFNYYVHRNSQIPFLIKLQYNLANRLVLEKGRSILGGRIRFMPCAGAALSEQIIRFFHGVGLNIIYGYGLTETTATVSCYPERRLVYGSVGSLMPEVEVKIWENDEILVKGNTVTQAYYKNEKANAAAFTDGWFRTGDAGYMDSDGNLFLKERIKDIIKTSSGKLIAPQAIESRIADNPYIEQLAVIGDTRKFISALIVPAYQALIEYAKQKGIKHSGIADLISNHEIIAFMISQVNKEQKEFADYEKIKRICLLANEFSIAGGELTSTLKIKRTAIEEKFRAEIESMYADS